jgi:predicted RNase H-like nuclease (RuvC/YqgF family)
MMCLFKGIFRTGVLATVVLSAIAGGAVLVAGADRTKAAFHQMHEKVISTIDEAIDDPVALRSQLIELEKEYPQRIAQVRGDMAELDSQLRQLEREREISRRVVNLADRDVMELEPRVKQAAANSNENGVRLAAVTFNDKVYSYERAARKLNQIRQTRVAYANRAADADHDLTYLNQQADRMGDLLAQLEGEHAQFQSQLLQLSRQVDSIARNERLISLLDKRNKTIEECSRYSVVSLDQLTGKLSEIRSRQEATLDVLASHSKQVDYEDVARMQIDSEGVDTTYESDVIEYDNAPVASASSRQ